MYHYAWSEVSSIHHPHPQYLSLRPILLLYSHLLIVFQLDVFTVLQPESSTYFPHSQPCTCSANCSLQDFCILATIHHLRKSGSFSPCNIPTCSLTLTFWGKNIFFSILIVNSCIARNNPVYKQRPSKEEKTSTIPDKYNFCAKELKKSCNDQQYKHILTKAYITRILSLQKKIHKIK